MKKLLYLLLALFVAFLCWTPPHIMKLLSTLFILLILVCPARGAARYFAPPRDDGRAAANDAARRAAIGNAFDRKAAEQATEQQKQAALAKEPWRIVGGVTNSIFGEGWFHFSGTVLQVDASRSRVEGPNGKSAKGLRGIRVSGSISSLSHYAPISMEFYVVNFPYTYADRDLIEPSLYFMAKAAGTITIGSTTLHKFDYGRVTAPPPEIVAAAATRADKAKEEADAVVLKFDQEKAAAGNALYQNRMGRRYLTGNGVEKDLAKARQLFENAAAQGNQDAVTELAKLSAPELPPQTNSHPNKGEDH